MKTLTIPEFHAAIKAQGAPSREDVAFRCVMCGTVQSMRSLADAGAGVDPEKYVGFSCEGRFRGAGPAKSDRKPASPDVRGCDWTLGGLFNVHTTEVVDDDGKRHPRFELATTEEAAALFLAMTKSGEGNA